MLHRPVKRLRRRLCDPSWLWKVLALLQAILSIWLIQATQGNPSTTLLAVVLWGGAVICIEDQLDALRLRPRLPSAFLGMALLAYATWKSATVLDLDSSVYLLPLIQGLGLAMVAMPVRRLPRFKEAYAVLGLFPLQLALFKLLPEYWISVFTGKVTQVILLIFGMQASAVGRLVMLDRAAVSIASTCSGIDLITQVTAIAIVFVFAFPIQGDLVKALYIALAPFVALFVNACRIALLAVIQNSSIPFKTEAFDFMHEDWGSLVFAGIATLVMGQIYMLLIDRCLSSRHG